MKLNLRKMKIVIIELILIMAICFMIVPIGYFEAKISIQTEIGTNIKISGTYENITIDNLPGSWNNWEWAENQEWCTGLGTLQNPYIIQGHTLGIDSIFDGIDIQNSEDIYFIIENCTFFWDGFISIGFESAISLVNVTNGLINDNLIHGMPIGIELTQCEDIILTKNTIYGTMGAIYISQSESIEIYDNTVYNSEYGVGLSLSDNNFIYNNTFYSNSNGIQLSNSDFNEIYENKANNNNDNGILIWYSNNNTVTNNILNDNTSNGIELDYSHNNTISGNTGDGNVVAVVYLNFSEDNKIDENTGSGNNNGIFLEDGCDNNFIRNNVFYDNDIGIELYYSDFNTIVENNIFNNDFYGITLEQSLNNTISGNQASNNSQIGIRLTETSNYNTISGNTINDNEVGLYLYDANNNSITGNTICNSGSNGIYFEQDSDYQEITENIILNNAIGMNILGLNDFNLMFKNFYLRNGKHAYDEGTGNLWNSTTIGNYWDNHTGPDVSPQDGIVDISYNISGSSGSKDLLPIADDVEPSIMVNSPSSSDVFGTEAPAYDVTITDTYLHEMWYSLDGGMHNYTFTGSSGSIDQSTWDATSDGIITLMFHASDKPGNIGTAVVTIFKDTAGPIIVIDSPSSGAEFGVTAPAFIIKVTDDNLDAIWYSLDGGETNYTITTNATINQAAWAVLSEGSVTITFYANDTLGNLSFEEVTITKEIPTGGIDPTTITIIVVVSIVGAVAVIAGIYIFMKKRTSTE
ncbi:MAG: NosD domain-containing protein [Promethearchaeota archaeon]